MIFSPSLQRGGGTNIEYQQRADSSWCQGDLKQFGIVGLHSFEVDLFLKNNFAIQGHDI